MLDVNPLGASWEFSGGPLERSFNSDLGLEGLEPTSFSPGPARVNRLGRAIPKSRQPKPVIHAKNLMNANSKDVKELRKEVLSLTKRAESSEEKVSEFREKMKAMRSALTTKDKQLSLAKRSVEYLGAERDQLQATVVNDQAHTRKLETKLMGQQGLSEMTSQWKSMKAKVKSMEDTVRAAESKILASEEVQRRQKAEINTLRVALDVKARELSSIGGQEISSRLIYAVAKSREEGVAMAVQLNEQRDNTGRAEAELKKAQMEILRLQDTLEAQRAARELAETASIQAQAEARHSRANAEAASAQIQVAGESQQRVHEEKQRLQQELREARHRIGDLEDQLEEDQRQAHRAAEGSRQDMVTALADITRAATEQQQELVERIRQLQDTHKSEEANWAEEREKLLRRVGQAEAEAGSCKSRVEEAESSGALRAAELQAEVTNLHKDLDSVTEVNHKLQSKLELTLGQKEVEEQRCAKLNQRIAAQNVEHEESRMAAEASAHARVNDVVQKLAKVQEEREALTAKLAHSLEQAMSVAAGKEVAQNEVKRLKEINESLSFSKGDLQRGMMEQLAGAQARVAVLERENAQLREWNPPTVSVSDQVVSAPPPTIHDQRSRGPSLTEEFPGENAATQRYHQAMSPSGRPAPRPNLYSYSSPTATGETNRHGQNDDVAPSAPGHHHYGDQPSSQNVGYGRPEKGPRDDYPYSNSYEYTYATNSHDPPMEPAPLPTLNNPNPDASAAAPGGGGGTAGFQQHEAYGRLSQQVPFDAVNAYTEALRSSGKSSTHHRESNHGPSEAHPAASVEYASASHAYQASSSPPWPANRGGVVGAYRDDGLRSPPDSPGNYGGGPISPPESPIMSQRNGPNPDGGGIMSLTDLANLELNGGSL